VPLVIPVNATVHYKTGFDIEIPHQEPMTYLRRIVRQWCQDTTGDATILRRRWFLTGYDPSKNTHYDVNGYQIRTAVAPSDDPREPNCWALEVIHGDADVPSRKWAVEVVLQKTGPNLVTFTTVVCNWLTPFFIGEYPPAPLPSVPGYVCDLIDDPTLLCHKGTTLLLTTPCDVTTDNVDDLYTTIVSSERFVPVVVLSYHSPSRGPLLDPSALAEAIAGCANAYVLTGTAVNSHLNRELGVAYNLAAGSVRVFLPGMDKSSESDYRRHRWLSPKYIVKCGSDTIVRYITNGLCRNASSFRLKDLTSFNDVLAERRKQNIARLARERESLASAQESTAGDTTMLWAEIATLTKENEGWKTEAAQLDSEVTTLRKQNGTLTMRVEEADRLRGQFRDLTSQVEAMKHLTKLPASLPDVLDVVEKMFPDRVVITDDARESARRHSNDHPSVWKKLDGVQVAWRMMFSLAVNFHAIVFEKKAKDLETAFQSETGIELAFTETGTTKADASLMALRKIEWNGTTVDITPHLKYGTRNPDMLRLHFAIDRKHRRIIVGHCGDHLKTSSSRKRH